MNFKTLYKEYPVDVRQTMSELNSAKLWEALDNYDLVEVGKLVYLHLDATKTAIEDDIGFDPDEAGKDVICESQKADSKQYNRR